MEKRAAEIKRLFAELENGSMEAAHTLCAEMWNEIYENKFSYKTDTTVSRALPTLSADCAYCHVDIKDTCMDGECALYEDADCTEYFSWFDTMYEGDHEQARVHAFRIAEIACDIAD